MLNLFGAKKTSPHIHRYTIFVGGAKFESWLSWSFRNNTHLPLQAMEDISSIKKYAGTISPTKSSTSLHVARTCFFISIILQDRTPYHSPDCPEAPSSKGLLQSYPNYRASWKAKAIGVLNWVKFHISHPNPPCMQCLDTYMDGLSLW